MYGLFEVGFKILRNMSNTKKDLKSHKKGFGKYSFNKPKRKLTPFKLDADKEEGSRTGVLVCTDTDLSQDGFDKNEHWNNARRVRALRRQQRDERRQEKHSARNKLKRELRDKILNEASEK